MNKSITFIAKARDVLSNHGDIIEVATDGITLYNTIGENRFFDLESDEIYEITITKLDKK